MPEITLIFPNQLFKEHPAVKKDRPVMLVEEKLFFRQYSFHKQKLILHRATMKSYEDHLQKQGFRVTYINSTEKEADIRALLPFLKKEKFTSLHYCDPVDNWLEKRLASASVKTKLTCVQYDTPGFLNTMEEVNDFFDKKKSYFQTDFYIWQRKKRKLLLEKDMVPLGGKWSYDSENRKKIPASQKIPAIPFPEESAWVTEAKENINDQYAGNYGTAGPFMYPVDFAGAEKWLQEFFQSRFARFGDYEDAMIPAEHFLFHSVLTPVLNTGLLTPEYVIEEALQAVRKYKIPLNSLEGFIRQIVGWREFIRMVYEREGSAQRTRNFWGFKKKIPASFWTGETGILPVDTVIKKVLQTGYCHHIERLMVLGNFMLLCEFDPDEVYRWFMEMFIDSYDWVMVPNVYGMTQFADGGIMTTKPYISGSHYLLKMGNWQKGEWQEIWDGLFWRFLHFHRDFFSRNPRLGMLVTTFDKMSRDKQKRHLDIAEAFLDKLQG